MWVWSSDGISEPLNFFLRD